MKTLIKNSFGLTFVLVTALFLTTGCGGWLMKSGSGTASQQPDPLAGWKIDFHEQPSQAIEKDIQDYIQKLPPKQKGYTGTQFFYEDGNGQHAISIEIFEGNQNASWQHVLIYDKEDKRVKTIRYGYRRYVS